MMNLFDFIFKIFINGHVNMPISYLSVFLLTIIVLLYVSFKKKKDLNLTNSLLKEEYQKLIAKNRELEHEAIEMRANTNNKLHDKDLQIFELNKTVNELSQSIEEKITDYEAKFVELQCHLEKKEELAKQFQERIDHLSMLLEKSRKHSENLNNELDKLKATYSKNTLETNPFERLVKW